MIYLNLILIFRMCSITFFQKLLRNGRIWTRSMLHHHVVILLIDAIRGIALSLLSLDKLHSTLNSLQFLISCNKCRSFVIFTDARENLVAWSQLNTHLAFNSLLKINFVLIIFFSSISQVKISKIYLISNYNINLTICVLF